MSGPAPAGPLFRVASQWLLGGLLALTFIALFLAINALQRAATIVLQKSTKEGFGLTVAEAMWKGKPVIGGATGGITEQVVYGVTGYTVNSVEGVDLEVGVGG